MAADSSGIIYLYFPFVEKSNARITKKKSYSVIHFYRRPSPKKEPQVFGGNKSLGIATDIIPK